MKVADLEMIFSALQDSGARYLLVEGLAVIAHGYVRTTEDVYLVLDLGSPSAAKAMAGLERLGYRPLIPVQMQDFADPDKRKDWIENRNMKVFNLVSDRFPEASIDIFPEEPFVFETEFAAAAWKEISPNLKIPVVSISALIAMKTRAGRPQDQVDIDKLRRLHGSEQ
jgi:hypothetical protein